MLLMVGHPKIVNLSKQQKNRQNMLYFKVNSHQ